MKKIYILYLLLTVPLLGFGQNISGSTIVCGGSTTTYTVTRDNTQSIKTTAVITVTGGRVTNGNLTNNSFSLPTGNSFQVNIEWGDTPSNDRVIKAIINGDANHLPDIGTLRNIKVVSLKNYVIPLDKITASPYSNNNSDLITIDSNKSGKLTLNVNNLYYPYFENYIGYEITDFQWTLNGVKFNGGKTFEVEYGENKNTITITVTPLGKKCSQIQSGNPQTIYIVRNDPCPTFYQSNVVISSPLNIGACKIVLENVSITNNTTVNITGQESVILKPNFVAQSGTTVVIKAADSSSALRTKASDVSEENSGVSETKEDISENLSQNVPNPFSDRTRVNYFVPEESQSAYISVYTLQGNLLKKVPIESKGAGEIYVDAAGLTSGLYLYSLVIDGVKVDTKRMYVK